MPRLSIVIPARNEEFLSRTIEDICEHMEDDTEVIAVCDGGWPVVPIKVHPRVKVLMFPEAVGQRAATNYGVRLSDAKYVMKCDAHCAFDQGFDRKMLDLMEDDVTMVPVMRNLHAFDWVCPNGHRRYQGPSGPCRECGEPTEKDVVWIPKNNPQSTCYRFDKTMHFQYWNEHGKEQKGDLTETMSLQGSCFLMTQEKYWELEICDEAHGSWGQQGVEVACKTWLSGGRVLVNRTTWYAHMFRTQGGDFSFPYPLSGKDVDKARKYSREQFREGKWKGAKRPFSWLLEKFNPPEWRAQEGAKAIVYYTDNRLPWRLARRFRDQIQQSGLPIVSCSLKPIPFGDKRVVVEADPSYETMYRQILAAAEAADAEILYLCEHDVLYPREHFDFVPPDDKFYYDTNVWVLRLSDGHAVSYNLSPLSALVVRREPLIEHLKERLEMIREIGFSRHIGFEPFTHKRIKWKRWFGADYFSSPRPLIDVAHAGNSTWKRWSPQDFRRKPGFWEESEGYSIPGWEGLPDLLGLTAEVA